MPKVTIIIVNYNTRELLRQCLTNLNNIYPFLQIIVTDNSSSDGSAQMVETEFHWVDLVKSENKGLAHGSNLALLKAEGEYILFLGTDAYPKSSDIEGLVGYMEANPEVGIATAKLVMRDGKTDMDCHRGMPTPFTALSRFFRLDKVFPKSPIFNHYFLGHLNLNTAHEIDLCIAHFMFVRKSVFDKVGNWDERFFLYGEDVDMCYRVKQAGYKIMYLPQFEVLHYKGGGVPLRKHSNDIDNAAKRDKKLKYKLIQSTAEAMGIFVEKHYSQKYPKWFFKFVFFGTKVLGWVRSFGLFLS